MSQTPSNPNQPPQGQSPFWGNMQPPQQGQPFNPQYPSGQYPTTVNQQQLFGSNPQRAVSTTTHDATCSTASSKKKSRKGLIIGAIVLIVALALCGIISSHSATATTIAKCCTTN